MAEDHVFRLSNIDQTLIRTYIRYCLCFPCQLEDANIVQEKLSSAAQRALAHLPILAGHVRYVQEDENLQHRLSEEMFERKGAPTAITPTSPRRIEVSVNLDDVKRFHAVVAKVPFSEFEHSYEELAISNMPPDLLVSDSLTPLPDTPEITDRGVPVFAIRANIICGGVLVALYLNHSVADLQSLGDIIKLLSSSMQPRELTEHDLATNAAAQSKARGELSTSKATVCDYTECPEYIHSRMRSLALDSAISDTENGRCHILAFDLAGIEETKNEINERWHGILDNGPKHISAFDCLATILWKAVCRATWPQGPAEGDMNRLLSLTIPVNIRKHISPPILPEDYFGNAVVHADLHAGIARLAKAYDLSSLAHHAHQIRAAIDRIDERVVRARIDALQWAHDPSEAAISNRNFDISLVITSWADLPTSESEAGLGLGLGAPQCGRKMGECHSAFGCIVLPVSREDGLWEVQVTLTQSVMARLLSDEGLMRFVKHVI
ncbi:hypothetical protein LTR86_002150 [Recurvomyces mirabilis]|nr:hypothetical protein LTR86_002150 [Recurvomyces mirabilis]